MDSKEAKVLNWNVEGLKGVMSALSTDIFNNFDASILTETFITEDTRIEVKGLYNIHSTCIGDKRGERQTVRGSDMPN